MQRRLGLLLLSLAKVNGGYRAAGACTLFVVAAGAGTDVIPCRVLYDTPDGRMKLFCRVRVVFGEPMPAAQFQMAGRRDIKTLKANKQALTAAWIDLGDRYAFEGAAHA